MTCSLLDTLPEIGRRHTKRTPESGGRAGYDGGKCRKGSKIHAAVDTMGNFITLMVSAAHEQDREQVYGLCKEIRQITGEKVDVVLADQKYTGENANIDVAVNGVELVVVKRLTSKKGVVLLLLRWVVERSFAWKARFRRLARDLDRLESSLLGFHWLVAFTLLVHKLQLILGSLD